MGEASAATGAVRVRVWDLPTRLFHWALAASVIGAVITAKVGGNAMVWHLRLGYVVAALLLFRLVWGLIGGRWSRFASFIYGPAAYLRYLGGRAREDDRFEVGHNPLGALSVFAMLGWLAIQVGSGLVADDEIAVTGPLVRFVSSETSLAWTAHHKTWGQWLVFVLLGLHLLAIVFYRWRKGGAMLKAMVGGDKQLPAETPAARDDVATRLLAAAVLGLAAALVYWLIGLGAV
jgi:cytochrome b